ncbi:MULTISPECIES: tRNA pseudouridine(38-40) synthase TruA [unclassified Campylobacter]|uniref:tRNA pseudouridine(38-40) synthase TruA n=1 Tax=unclassified Campylobacter TaxID=2593542 RepID=UPI001237FC0D|nr:MULTISPECIES: tRNA pseudouridine(38-40) synthase TruA [unclassified Campylobacter]KAA6225614.1 tRNA pseudouridine(38-40) synthase TruA [Campylobacter sp. LR185c]KAA6227534.1 tRNA pseudouridine(38-40) synthase TruA [Campylobacter sp. LR196d]KAA6228561.1 tRNA pseudouridine(38-40) synthase TruA [Campylobacter sp. LR286c]KAA6230951.1 tRNA pseudouridine(38-40) synthase TruA [Campylobacter sp. LR291e]KAA6233585.1 tRNA pseudouridine(38-40) synthase TruA [Campylobacter sp. LR264d]
MKLKLTLAYNGITFLGSACQPHQNSVQDKLANALTHLGIYQRPLFASRTDKGVHASGAVACIECGEHFKDLAYLKRQINKFATPHIYIKKIEKVDNNFEVRFNAKAREYRYIFCHKEFNPFLSDFVYFYPEFDIKKAKELLKLFEGTHDFKFFQKTNDLNTSIRTIYLTKAYKIKEFSVFKFRANGFLRAQIRLSVQAILATLNQKINEKNLLEQIEGKRAYIRELAPANGLYLSKIIY